MRLSAWAISGTARHRAAISCRYVAPKRATRSARALEAHAKQTLGIDFHETTADGAITLEPVYCLGKCGCGPSLLIDADDLQARVTPKKFDTLMRVAREATS